MKEFEPDYIEKVIDIMRNNEITEIILEDNNKSLVIKDSGYKPVIKEKEESDYCITEENIPQPETEQQEEEKKKLTPIVSNMIGLYFAKPSPDEKPFVNVGDEIKEGQVICIIETIKLMNKITSNFLGKIAEICIEDGQPVEYGQVIMYVEEK